MRTFILATLLSALALFGSTAASAQTQPQNLPREILINGVEFVLVPEGWFWYAVENGDRERVVQQGKPWFRDVRVWLDGYYIAKYEARARDFKRFLETKVVRHRSDYLDAETNGCSLRRSASGDYYLTEPELDLPATQLSWNLAEEFTRWMGFRIPTEAQWVKAARGTDRRIWPWGDEYPDDTFADFLVPGGCSRTSVDAFSNGKSPYGAYNMAGNVFEYVADWYNEPFDLGLKDGERNPVLATSATLAADIAEPMKILKGGSWNTGANFIHVYARFLYPPSQLFHCSGVRFAVDLATVRAHLANGSATVLER